MKVHSRYAHEWMLTRHYSACPVPEQELPKTAPEQNP